MGSVAETLREAWQRLHSPPEIIVGPMSSLHRTSAVGADAGGEFINAAGRLETSLAARELLQRLHTVEAEFGRVRTLRWGPRTLDLDLLFFGDAIIDAAPHLQVPHPAAWYRRFVLDPLVEIASSFVHPVKRRTIGELRERLLVRPLPVQIVETGEPTPKLLEPLAWEFPSAALSRCSRREDVSYDDVGLLIAVGDGPLPDWTRPLTARTGWLDTRGPTSAVRQTVVDILRSAGL
jgi:2-amino-4-hydroxy-6-hydroxymethyldihydropteridine diphosphokinase